MKNINKTKQRFVINVPFMLLVCFNLSCMRFFLSFFPLTQKRYKLKEGSSDDHGLHLKHFPTFLHHRISSIHYERQLKPVKARQRIHH